MSTFSLDQIKAAADAKYGSLDVPFGDKTAVFLNPLRLGAKKREAMKGLQADMKADKIEQEEFVDKFLLLAAKDEKVAEQLLDEIGDDLALKVTILEQYGEGTQVGEASASQD